MPLRRLYNGYTVILSLFFGAVGLPAFFLASTLAKESINLVDHGIRSQGTVVEMTPVSGKKGRRTYRPTIRFTTPNGDIITSSGFSSSNPARYNVGDGVVVIYPADNPQNATIDSALDLWMPPILVGLIGLGFMLIGVIAVLRSLKKRRLYSWLRQYGQRIVTNYTGVHANIRIRFNGRHPFYIVSNWRDPSTGKDYTFQSEDFLDDPSDQLQGTRTIEVLIDPMNPSRYRMDTAFLK